MLFRSVLDLSAQRKIEEQSRTSQERLAATARLAMAGTLAVLVGDTLFALRRVEAACVDVTPA